MSKRSTEYFLKGFPRLVKEYRSKMGFWTAKREAKEDILLAALNSAESWEDVRDCLIFMIRQKDS